MPPDIADFTGIHLFSGKSPILRDKLRQSAGSGTGRGSIPGSKVGSEMGSGIGSDLGGFGGQGRAASRREIWGNAGESGKFRGAGRAREWVQKSDPKWVRKMGGNGVHFRGRKSPENGPEMSDSRLDRVGIGRKSGPGGRREICKKIVKNRN